MKNTIFNKFPKQPYTIYNVVRCFLSFFNYWGTANWYKGIDQPTLRQRLYKWRISPKTAWTLAKGIWVGFEQRGLWGYGSHTSEGKILLPTVHGFAKRWTLKNKCSIKNKR